VKKKEFFDSLLKQYSISPKDLEHIIANRLSISPKELFLLEDIDEKKKKSIIKDIKKYKKGLPLAYIEKRASFMGLNFFVNKHVLIPRIDTEVLVWQVGNFLQGAKKNYIIGDIGTWSGCILASLLHFYDDVIISSFALDISKKALKVAKKNIEIYDKNKKTHFYHISFSALEKVLKKENVFWKDILLSANLPYIRKWDTDLEKNVLSYEPKKALFWWKKTGFELYEKLIEILIILKEKYTLKSLVLFIEIGYKQKEIASYFLENKGLSYSFFLDTWWKTRGVQIDF